MTRELFLFLSSPSDCQQEREAVRKVVGRLNSNPLLRSQFRITIEASDTDHGVPMPSSLPPSNGVDLAIKTPEECDLFICIFRNRFGTPPSKLKDDGTPYLSGTEYEFYRARNQAKLKDGFQTYMLTYRGPMDETVQDADSVNQRKLVGEFFNGSCFFDPQGSATGAFHRFEAVEEFTRQLEGHLLQYLKQCIPWLSQSFPSWLHIQRDKLVKDAGPRYTRNAHVETGIMSSFDWLLRTPAAFKILDEALERVYKSLPHKEPPTSELKKDFKSLAAKLRGTEFWRDDIDFSAMEKLLERVTAAYRPLQEKAEKERQKLLAEGNEKYSEPVRAVSDRLHSLSSVIYETQQCQRLLEENSEFATKRVILIVGPAGQGKTHTLVEQVSRRVDNGHVALGVLGQKLMLGGELWAELFSVLGIPSTTTVHDFLTTIDLQARQRQSVALLAFDALNETVPRSRWQEQLLGLLEEISRFPNIAVVLAVREDYLPYTLPVLPKKAVTPWVAVNHRGFAGVEAGAMASYFAAYGLEAPVFPSIIPELTNPLYLKILCQSLENRRDHGLPILLPSWLDVHKMWIEILEIKAKGSPELGLDTLKNKIIYKTISKIADTMLANGATSLMRETAEQIARDIAGTPRLISFLISEQVLFETIEGNSDEEQVQFGYERFSDTFMAERLLSAIEKGKDGKPDVEAIRHAFAPDGRLHGYVKADHRSSYRNRAGVLSALMLQIPKQTGFELPDLLPASDEFSVYSIDSAFRDSLLWRSRREEFGGNRAYLWNLLTRGETRAPKLEYLIQLALIPGHPFDVTAVIHPRLKKCKTPGERDAVWTINLPELWEEEISSVFIMASWSATQNLIGIRRETAETIAILMAWCCTSSNSGLKDTATRGLCRLFKACPEIVAPMLVEFESVNDAYVAESLLLAVLGVVLDSGDITWVKEIAAAVYEQQFPNGNPRWCHLMIRHYARRIVERGTEVGLLLDVAVIRPPYSSRLALNKVPKNLKTLRKKDESKGFSRLVGSASDHDFYRYILKANSANFPFKAMSLQFSEEPTRLYTKVGRFSMGAAPQKDVFDITLAARFIIWNCLKLGWTSERFDKFDTGYQISQDRIIHGAKTERIGKKYQWIGWQTLQAFLTDHYPLNQRYSDAECDYDTPKQLDEEIPDPLRWLVEAPKSVAQLTGQEITEHDDSEAIPVTTPWPEPSEESINTWINTPDKTPSFSSCLLSVPLAATQVQPGKWIRACFEFTWEQAWRPGYWTLPELNANIWSFARARLVKSADMNKLKATLSQEHVQGKMSEIFPEYPGIRNATLDQWLNHEESLEPGFLAVSKTEYADNDYWPVKYAHPLATLGANESGRVEREITLPSPWLIRQWDMALDKETGTYRIPDGRVVFYNAGINGRNNAMFVSLDTVRELLQKSGWSLLWFIRGEEFAGLLPHYDFARRIDVHGVACLDEAGYPEVLWINRMLE